MLISARVHKYKRWKSETEISNGEKKKNYYGRVLSLSGNFYICPVTVKYSSNIYVEPKKKYILHTYRKVQSVLIIVKRIPP